MKVARSSRPASLFCARRSFSEVLNDMRLNSSQVRTSRHEREARMAKVRLNLKIFMFCATP